MAVSFAANIRPMFTDMDIAHMKNLRPCGSRLVSAGSHLLREVRVVGVAGTIDVWRVPHAAAACVLLFRAVRGHRDQARQPQLIPAGGPPRLVTETNK